MFCLPPHTTHLLQPLGVELIGPLQHCHGIGIDEYFCDYGENFGFAPQHSLPIYLEARWKAYSLANIESAFRVTGIVPLNSCVLIKSRVEAQRKLESVLPEKTPYTKCQLRQQITAALAFVKTATPWNICNLILHAVEQSFATAEIAYSEASRLRTQLKDSGGGSVSGQGGKKRKVWKVVSKAQVLTVGEGIAVVEEIIIIIIDHLRWQPEGYGAAICIFELWARIASSSPRFILLRCGEVLLFCRLVSVFITPSSENGRGDGSGGKRNERSQGGLEKAVCYANEWLGRSCYSCYSKAGPSAI